MEQSLAEMKVALRVLTAITEKRLPDPSDIQQLQQLAQIPSDAKLSDDELACEVIQIALKRRAKVRASGRG